MRIEAVSSGKIGVRADESLRRRNDVGRTIDQRATGCQEKLFRRGNRAVFSGKPSGEMMAGRGSQRFFAGCFAGRPGGRRRSA